MPVAMVAVIVVISLALYIAVSLSLSLLLLLPLLLSVTAYLTNRARNSKSTHVDTHMYTCMLICTHTHRQVNGEESTTNSFSRAEPVEPCPWDQTNVVHAKRALRPPSVENSDNESSEGESDQR